MSSCKKIKIVFLIFIVLSVSFIIGAFSQVQGQGAPKSPGVSVDEWAYQTLTKVEGQKGEIANCFDYYKFGSLSLDIYTDKTTYEQNDGVIFQGTLKNNNPYPVVDIGVYARIYKDYPNLIVDEFYLDKGINLASGAEVKINYPWMIHSKAASGFYRVNLYVVSGSKFNMSGLSFTDDVYASFADFEIAGANPDTVYLDRANTKINNQPYRYIGPLPSYETGKPINISIPLINNAKSEESVEVAYTLYYWDGLLEQNTLKQTKERINLKNNSSQILTYVIDNPILPVYYLRIVAKPLNQKIINITQASITNIRILTNASQGRFNFLGVTGFPFKANQSYDFFACFHNTSAGLLKGSEVNAALKDKEGNILAALSFPGGAIPPTVSAIKTAFQSPNNYDYLVLEANIIDKDGKIVDKISQVYDCSRFNPALCFPSKERLLDKILKMLISPWGIAVLTALILAIIFSLIVRKKKIDQGGSGQPPQINY